MNEQRMYKQYTQELRDEAVSLVSEQGYSVQKAVDSLSIRAICSTAGKSNWKPENQAKRFLKMNLLS